MSEPVLLALMPFGERDVFASGEFHRVDFDRLYHDVLKPAAVDAGFIPMRADDIGGTGVITSQIVEMLTRASAVIADISTANGNVLYELGAWHALGNGPTLLIATSGTSIPFDLAHMRVHFYDTSLKSVPLLLDAMQHLRSRLGTQEGNPMDATLRALAVKPDPKSVAQIDEEVRHRVQRSSSVSQLIAAWHWASSVKPSASVRIELANKLADLEAYSEAIGVLGRDEEESDYELMQRRGFFKRRINDFAGAKEDLEAALRLNPDDPETLGLLGGLSRRMGDIPKAIVYYSRAFDIAPSSTYIKIANAELQLIFGLRELALQWYEDLARGVDEDGRQTNPWALLIGSEAAFVLKRDDEAEEYVRRAISAGATRSQLQSLVDQLAFFEQHGWRTEAAHALREEIRVGMSPHSRPTRSTSTTVVVHLSDLHFGNKETKNGLTEMHRFRADDENSSTLEESLVRDLRDLESHGVLRTSEIALVVSGDLTYNATRGEFDEALTFLTGICDALSISHESVVIVPGNHDVNWAEATLDISRRFDQFLSFLRSFYGESLFASRYPFISWNFAFDADRPRAREIVQLCEIKGTWFIGLNSCVFETPQDHYGFVGQKQLQLVSDHIRQSEATAPFVGIMHHHLHPFPEYLQAPAGGNVWLDLSIARDSGFIEKSLESLGANLLLHGHKHKPQLRSTRLLDKYISDDNPVTDLALIVNGGGSTGVAQPELEHDQGNHYSVIRLGHDGRMEILWREMGFYPGARWRTTNRWIVPGRN